VSETSHGFEIRAQFAKRAPTYNNLAVWVEDSRLEHEIRRGLSSLRQDARCLDIGAGTGVLTRRLRSGPGRWAAVDISWEMLVAGRFVNSVVGAAEHLPLADSSIDAIVCRSVLAYLDLNAALDEFWRILTEGGVLIVAEKVAGDYAPDHTDWLERVQGLRNPLKSPPIETHEITAAVTGAWFHLDSTIELRRVYTQNLDDWLRRGGTIDLQSQAELVRLLATPPPQIRRFVGEKGEPLLGMSRSWAIVAARKESKKGALPPLVATVVPMRLGDDGGIQIYLQRRRAPIFSEPEFLNTWEFPQGHVEAGESFLSAGDRELREEAGMRVTRWLGTTEEDVRERGRHRTYDVVGAGIVRIEGRLNYGAQWTPAAIDYVEVAGSVEHPGTWFSLTEAADLLESGSVYPLNEPMLVRVLDQAESFRHELDAIK
jgi:8-oxo-dGTP pyrophosphatase MutT (NUDIX family)/SAM-dependent methyltransferase